MLPEHINFLSKFHRFSVSRIKPTYLYEIPLGDNVRAIIIWEEKDDATSECKGAFTFNMSDRPMLLQEKDFVKIVIGNSIEETYELLQKALQEFAQNISFQIQQESLIAFTKKG